MTPKTSRPAGTQPETGQTTVVNTSPWKVDGIGLVTGAPLFVDDLQLRGTLHVKLLGSPHAHARIRSIDVSEALRVKGVQLILTHENTPRVPHTTAGQGYPEPSPYDAFMFDTKVRFVGDRVAAVVAETATAAREARKRIRVDYEVLPAILSVRDAKRPGAPVIHDEPDATGIHDARRNVAAHFDFEHGSVAMGFEMADLIVETEIENGYAQHCPIEPHVCLTYLDPEGRVVVRTSTQVPFHCRRILAQCLQIPVSRIRVIKPRVGGGFGTKQEILLEDVCALATLRTGRPVKWELTRAEEFYASRTRHPMVVNVKIGVKPNGDITALDMRALSNTGAYGTHSLTVLTNAGAKTLPLYHAEHVRFDGDAVYTNLPVAGAYRGYGGTQGAFALETLIDEVCERGGFDPIAFRKRNALDTGHTSPVFAAMGEGKEGVPMVIESCGLRECIDRGAEAIGWAHKRGQGRHRPGPVKRGVGMACLMQGSGIPLIDMAAARIKMNEDGSFNLFAGATDIGTGSDTVLAQIAAEVLTVPTHMVNVLSSDTDVTPFDTGAYASSTTYISGGAVKKAAEALRAEIFDYCAEMWNVPPETLHLEAGQVLSAQGQSIAFSDLVLRAFMGFGGMQRQFEGHASHTSPTSPPPFSAHFAEVEVDTETGNVRVLDYVAAVDCGVAIHPLQAEGQVEGAALNGISYALCEQMVFDARGKLRNDSFADYKIFTSLDAPPIRTILVKTHEPTGPFGAKSIAEICINGPIPAIANAIADAVGIRLRRSPFTPERVLEALRAKAGAEAVL
ncbi:MAG: molybdopterin-dependent oxidoreductase [Candidatus Sumerlaeia bacterium]|nr:molybdopterin-dependent oxidoreductase [Candidatus Sumerlaeia bacterium]